VHPDKENVKTADISKRQELFLIVGNY
jgi:hypothetical protein